MRAALSALVIAIYAAVVAVMVAHVVVMPVIGWLWLLGWLV